MSLHRPLAVLLTFLVLTALGGVGVASAQAAWGRPFQLSRPGSLDYLGPQVTYSSTGASAAAFGIDDVDTPGSGQAYLVGRTAGGRVGTPRPVTGARQVLSLAYDGKPLELLVGTSPKHQTCCSSAQAIQVSPSGAQRKPRTLVGGLTGFTEGQLLTLANGQMMAAVATERGVWVVQSAKADRFAGPHLISNAGQQPVSMSAAWLGGGNTIVAWTAGTGIAGATQPRSIDYALGSSTQAPHRARVALTVAPTHRIDELAVARRGSGATLAWVESWYDRTGAYHSRVQAADLAKGASTRALSPDNRLASGLAFDSDAAGDQGVAWESCTTSQACTVQSAQRTAQGSFSTPGTLGAIDPYETPALAVGPAGQVIVAWVRGGHPVAAVGPVSGRPGAPSVLSSTTFAMDPTLAFGPKREALAAWTQGTLNPSVVAAAYVAP